MNSHEGNSIKTNSMIFNTLIKKWQKRKSFLQSGNMLVIMVFLIIYSCSSPNIDKIEIIYLPKDLNTPISIDSCYKMYNYHYLMSDTIIKNTDFNRKLQIEINRLETDKSNASKSIDFRIACLIIMENGDTNRLGLNTLGGIKYNDIVMKDSPNLFNLFDITLYKNRNN